jgi:hypothetical protein
MKIKKKPEANAEDVGLQQILQSELLIALVLSFLFNYYLIIHIFLAVKQDSTSNEPIDRSTTKQS